MTEMLVIRERCVCPPLTEMEKTTGCTSSAPMSVLPPKVRT